MLSSLAAIGFTCGLSPNQQAKDQDVMLRRKGWIQAKAGEDRREVRLTLTAEGEREYLSAVPYWRSAQGQVKNVLGEAGWKQMMESTIYTAALAQHGHFRR